MRYSLQNEQKSALTCRTRFDENGQAFAGFQIGVFGGSRLKKKNLSESVESTENPTNSAPASLPNPIKVAPALQKTIAIPTSLFQTKKIVEEKAKQQAVIHEEKKIIQEEIQTGSSELLTQQIFDVVLPKILDDFKAQNRGLELAILNQPIEIIESEILLLVTGHVQEEIALKMKPDLLSLVKQYTGLARVSMRLEIKEELASNKNTLYTDSDKFAFLKNKHAALGEFQRIFGLETDY
jgi:hypothetical protein